MIWTVITDVFLGVALVAQYSIIVDQKRRLKASNDAVSSVFGTLDEQIQEMINVINTNADQLADFITETRKDK
jgi:hypothetical protein